MSPTTAAIISVVLLVFLFLMRMPVVVLLVFPERRSYVCFYGDHCFLFGNEW
jgi:hypothetical protein